MKVDFSSDQVQLEAKNSKTACTKLDFSRPQLQLEAKNSAQLQLNRDFSTGSAPRPAPATRRASLREVLRKSRQHAVLLSAHKVQVRHGEVADLVRVAGGDGAV